MCVSFDKMDLKSFLFYFGLIVEIHSRCTYSLGKNPWWKKDIEPPIEQVQTGILKRQCYGINFAPIKRYYNFVFSFKYSLCYICLFLSYSFSKSDHQNPQRNKLIDLCQNPYKFRQKFIYLLGFNQGYEQGEGLCLSCDLLAILL